MKPKDLIESQLPSHFLEQYPQFVKFLEQYYDFLESTVLVLEDNRTISAGDNVYGVLSKSKAQIKNVSSDRIYFDYKSKENNFYKREILVNPKNGEFYQIKNVYSNVYNYIQNIEDNTCYDMAMNLYKKFFRKNVSLDASVFRRIDPKVLTKRILDYYRNKGTENSFYWFFRIFFEEGIELYYPKVDILRLSDSDYRVRQWVRIDPVENYERIKSTAIFAEGSKTSAIVRDVYTTSMNGLSKIYLDLVFVNGKFNSNEEIISSDYITGEEVLRTKILASPIGVKPTDGGIYHQKEDRFRFGSLESDGKGKIIETKQYSITNIIPEHRGICYSVGDEIQFDNSFTGATAFAKARVSKVHKNETLTDWINSYSDNAIRLEITKISQETIVDLWDRVIGESLTQAKENNDYKPIPALDNAANQVADIGSIAEIQFEKSGLNYKFAPKASVESRIDALKNFIYLEVVVNKDDYLYAVEDTIIEIFGRRGFCIGSKTYEEGTLLDIGLLSESYKVIQIIVDKNVETTVSGGNQVNVFPDTSLTTSSNKKLVDYAQDDVYFEFSELIADNPRIKAYPNTFTIEKLEEILDASGNPIGAAAYSDSATFLLTDGSIQAEHNVKFIDAREVVKVSLLHDTAELTSVLGQGASELKLTELGLIGQQGLFPVFKDEIIKRKAPVLPEYQNYSEFYQKIYSIYEIKQDPARIADFDYERRTFGGFIGTQNLDKLMDLFDLGNQSIAIEDLVKQIAYDNTRVAHNLPAKLEYEYGAMYKQFGEYVGRGSHLSEDKYIQDNYYYQNFSYEIRTKVQAVDIEPLLMDELHPAGFIMFVRNKFEFEMEMRLRAFEFPEIEIDSVGLYRDYRDGKLKDLSGRKYRKDAGYDYYANNMFHTGEHEIENAPRTDQIWIRNNESGDLMTGNNYFRSANTAVIFPEIEVNNSEDLSSETLAQKELEILVENYFLKKTHWNGNKFIDEIEEHQRIEEEIQDIEKEIASKVSGNELLYKLRNFEEQLESLRAFHYFWEDVITIPEHFNLNNFMSYTDKVIDHIDQHGNPVYKTLSSTSDPTGALTSVNTLQQRWDQQNKRQFRPNNSYVPPELLLQVISNYADEEFTEYLEDFVNVEGPEKVRGHYYRPEYMKLYQKLNIVNSVLGKRKEMIDGKMVMLDLIPAVQSFTIVKMLEDQANWRTVPIRQRTGTIGELGKEPITNLRTTSTSSYQMTNSSNYGGVIIVRDDAYSTPVIVGNATSDLKNHGFCSSVEIYTKDGWVQFQDLKSKQMVAHVEETGKITWKVLKKIHKQRFHGKLHHITNAKAMTTNFVPALDRMVLKNISAPISAFFGEVVVPHKMGAKIDEASLTVAPGTDLVLFATNEKYQKVSADSMNYSDRISYIGTVNEDLINFPVSVVNKNKLSTFRKTEIDHNGFIYTISLDNIKPHTPAQMKWGDVEMAFFDMAGPENQAKFALSLKEVVQKVANISNIRAKDSSLTDDQNRGRIDVVKFGESLMYLLNVNDTKKGQIPQALDDTKMFRFTGFEIPVKMKGSRIDTNIKNEKIIFDRAKCFDVNGNILPDAPIHSLAKGKLVANMRETIPTVSADNIDYSIFNITDVEHIKPELVERYDQIYHFQEHFMELSTNQVCFFINTTNTYIPSAELKEREWAIYVDSQGEKHPAELLENVIDIEVFHNKNMFMKLNEHPVELEIHKHIPDRWKCVDINQQIPFDEVIGSKNTSDQKIWEKIRESIPTARIVENQTSLIMDLVESMPQKVEFKDQETHIETFFEHKFGTEAETTLLEVEVDKHLLNRWDLIDINQTIPIEDIIADDEEEAKKIWNNIRESMPTARVVESKKEIDKFYFENMRKEFEEKDSHNVVVSSQMYELELKSEIDALDFENEKIIFNRNYVFDATKPIDLLGNLSIKEHLLKLRPRLSIRDTLPTGKILEFAMDVKTINSVQSADLHDLVQEEEIEIDSVMETRNNLQHLKTGMKIENVNRIWNSNFVYELNTAILEMYDIPVEDLNNIALKESMDRISCPNGSSIIRNFEIHQESSISIETRSIETEYHILPDVIESTPVKISPLPNELQIKNNTKVSVEFAYLFEKEIRTEKMVGDLVTEKYEQESSVHALSGVELEQLSGVLFSKKGSVSKVQEEKLLIDETKLLVSPIYRIIKERSYETPWKLDEISSDFLTSQWATPYFGEMIDDYVDKILHDRDEDTYLHHNLNIQYVYPESIQYSANGIAELLNSNNYIDEHGTLLTGPLNYEDIVNSSNTYIKTLSAMETFYVD